jgi:hypothetical protein
MTKIFIDIPILDLIIDKLKKIVADVRVANLL